MAVDRYAVLGLARVRAPWFGDVARWATTAALPVDFVKVVSVEEACARLRSGRPFSALLIDGGLTGLDRDLVELAAAQGCAVLVVDDGRGLESWRELGVAGVLARSFAPAHLHDALRTLARPIVRTDDVPGAAPIQDADVPAWRGRLVAVTGPAGAGRSTLAVALATGLAADPRGHGVVLLADLALHGQQAVLHDAGDVMPGLLELVEGHRSRSVAPDEVRRGCFAVTARGYDLLLGLRRHRDWTALRPKAVAASLDALRRTYRLVVADVDADVEGEAECGSVDVEERNVLARTTLRDAELVVVVGRSGMTGTHAHERTIRDLVGFGVDGPRIVPVINRAPRSPRTRAEMGSALAKLLAATSPGVTLASTAIFVPERRRLDESQRDAAPPPPALVDPLTGAVRALLERLDQSSSGAPHGSGRVPSATPVAVVPGSLGAWSDETADGDAT